MSLIWRLRRRGCRGSLEESVGGAAAAVEQYLGFSRAQHDALGDPAPTGRDRVDPVTATRNDNGQGLVQHALLLSVVVVLCLGALTEIQANVHGLLGRVSASMSTAVGATQATPTTTTTPVTTSKSKSKAKKTKAG